MGPGPKNSNVDNFGVYSRYFGAIAAGHAAWIVA
jgi:hypothetical protein